MTIIERAHFTRMLQMAGLIEAPILLSAPRCRRCDVTLVRRSGRFGPFWGCPNYGPQKCRSHEEFRYTLVITAHADGSGVTAPTERAAAGTISAAGVSFPDPEWN